MRMQLLKRRRRRKKGSPCLHQIPTLLLFSFSLVIDHGHHHVYGRRRWSMLRLDRSPVARLLPVYRQISGVRPNGEQSTELLTT